MVSGSLMELLNTDRQPPPSFLDLPLLRPLPPCYLIKSFSIVAWPCPQGMGCIHGPQLWEVVLVEVEESINRSHPELVECFLFLLMVDLNQEEV